MSDLDTYVMHAGITSSGELSPEACEALYCYALDFFQCGGVISYSDWVGMASKTKEAFRKAKTSVRGEEIAVLAALFGVQVPSPRKNPTAPENRENWKELEKDDQELVTDIMEELLADKGL